MYKNSTLDKIDKTTLLYQNVKNYKKDNKLHTFLKNEFENQFLNNISVEQILKNNNIFLISNFNKKNFKKGKIKTFGLGVKNENSNLEVIKILFFDKKYKYSFSDRLMTPAVPYFPINDLEVHIIPKSKEIKIELLETDDQILDFYKELSEYYSKNNN